MGSGNDLYLSVRIAVRSFQVVLLSGTHVLTLFLALFLIFSASNLVGVLEVFVILVAKTESVFSLFPATRSVACLLFSLRWASSPLSNCCQCASSCCFCCGSVPQDAGTANDRAQ